MALRPRRDRYFVDYSTQAALKSFLYNHGFIHDDNTFSIEGPNMYFQGSNQFLSIVHAWLSGADAGFVLASTQT